MGNQSSKYTLKIDAEVSSLKSKLKVAIDTLEAFGQNDTTKQLESSFDALYKKIEKIGTSHGTELTAAQFEKLLKEIDKVDSGFDELTTSMRQLKSLSKDDKEAFFPTAVAKKIKDAKTATDTYSASIKKAAEDGKALATAKKEVDSIDKKIAQNQRNQSAAEKKAQAAEKNIATAQGKKAKVSAAKTKTTDPTELAALTKAEREYQKEITANQNLANGYRATLSDLESEEKALTTEKKKASAAYDELTTKMGGADTEAKQIQSAYSALRETARGLDVEVDDLGENFSKDDESKLLSRLRNLKTQGYDQIDRSVDKTVASLRDCSKAQKELTTTTKQQAQAVQQQDAVMENVSSLQSRISQYIGMQGIITALSRSLRDAFETVKELDASMTEMAVVTDLEVGDYWKQLPEYTKRASELGLVINDVYQADMLYYQQGLKTNEVIAVSTETMKMAKIAGLETADATDRMTAALRGFNMEINEVSAQRISDVYSELAAITASDVDEISTAMTKTASIASSAGMEFETTAAFLSQIIETTREAAETAGTALKTVIARFQELKKDPAEIGEVEGEIVDANKIETALRSVGVALRDSSGQFRELDDVFLELASKWNNLDKNTQRYIATIAAGSRQQSRFIAMMSDYGRTQELVAAANDSAGASNRQFEKTLASLETKLNKLKDAWDTFTMGLLDSDLIKGLVTILTGLLNVINKIFEVVDMIPFLGVVARLGLIVGGLILVDKVLKYFFASLKSGNGVLASAGAALRGYAIDANGVKIAIEKETAVIKNGTLGHYEWIVAAEMAKGATREEATEIAKKAMVEANSNLITEAGTKITLKDTWATLKKTTADKFQRIGVYASAVALQLKAMFTKEDMTATLASIPADVAKAASVAAIVIVVLLAVAAFALLVVGILALCGVFDSASKRLEEANKELEATEEATKKITEEYENLGTVLEELDSKYDTLEDLRRGTEEWNKAVQETNSSVLDLIDTYPELAALVENQGGVLTIDTDSDEVKNIMQQKENQMLTAQGALTGAKLNVAQLNAEAEYEMNHELIDDFSNRADDRVGVATGVRTALSGAAIGALVGSIIPVVGTVVGTIVGGVAGIAAGVFTGQAAEQATLLGDKAVKENINKLSKAYAKGDAGTTKSDMVKYIEEQGFATGQAAEEMADAFFKNKEELLAYGRTLNETEAQQKAYHQSLLTNAQQMLDLGLYTEKQIDQMNQIVDESIMDAYIEAERKLIEEMNGDELEKARREFAKSTYGSTARVDGDKILDELGNVLMTFENDEGWTTQMAAAKAMQRAADAMEQIPDMINSVRKTLDSKGVSGTNIAAIEKALSGKSLTKAEFERYSTVVGDPKNVDAIWDNLGTLQQSIYDGNKELLIKELESFTKQETDQWSKTYENIDKLNIEKTELSGKLDSASAQAWTFNLLDLAPNGKNMLALNKALKGILLGLTEEQTTLAMTEINAMDQMDKQAWEDLGYTFEQLGIKIPSKKLQDFIDQGIELSGAIDKINFSTLSSDINEAYKLLDKVKEGGRAYSDDEYQKLIKANKNLEKSFTKVGDDFVFTGGSIEELISAVQENTIALLGEANRQLASKTEMAKIISENAKTMADPIAMDREGLLQYLMKMRYDIAAAGYNISDFGHEGLDNATVFSDATTDQLKEWAKLIATEGANLTLYQKDYLESLKEANVLRYKEDNSSLYNSQQAMNIGSEYSAQHAKALELQAIESGGVSDAMIKQLTTYREALEDYWNKVEETNRMEAEFKAAQERGEATSDMENALEKSKNQVTELWGKVDDLVNNGIGKTVTQISNMIDDIQEENEKRDAYMDLIKQVEEAIVNLRQEEIDKLSEVNDSINDANDRLINKIQEQIDADRQARDNAEAEQEITDMRSRLAYLGADTSGVNALTTADLTKEIAEAEQDLQDERIDQAIANLEDANERAAEQRERQIDLLQQQLDTDQKLRNTAEQAKIIVDKGLAQVNAGTPIIESGIGELIAASAEWEYLTEEERKEAVSKLSKTGTMAADWKTNAPTNTTDLLSGGGKPVDSSHLTDVAAIEIKDRIKARRQTGIPFTKEALEQDSEYAKFKEQYLTNGGTNEQYEGMYWSTISEINDTINKHILPINKEDWSDYKTSYGKTFIKFKKFGDFGGGNQYVYPIGTSIELGGYPALASDHSGQIAYSGYNLYAALGDTWWEFYTDETEEQYTGTIKYADLLDYVKKNYSHLNAYESGGLADFTGPAWLDGTKSKPEIVLNQKDSANFLVLRDILSEVLDGSSGFSKSSEKQSGDNYYDIDISVEKLEDDYDVEQLADKIRRMIYDDATYRNVNTINLIR